MSKYTDAVERGLDGLKCVSVGLCEGCDECYQTYGDNDPSEFVDMMRNGELSDEGGFSSSECGICGSKLGGDRYIWHWVDEYNTIIHENDCCRDCLMYLANGDEPDSWDE